jgi:asparagine synthase (glutamine-hydrolysing)
MSSSLRHRGPDDEGFLFFGQEKVLTAGSNDTQKEAWTSDFVNKPESNIEEIKGSFYGAFGHRRLSIIDLSEAAHQPICNIEKTIWLTYNGELYNFQQLKKELEAKGHTFYSRTDAEVLLKAYEEWGFDCLDRFNGMWAFAIYDKRKNIIFGARDRFGVKPLYYYKDNDFFAFASEPKALLTLPFVNTSIEEKSLFEFLLSSQIELNDENFFKDIIELKNSDYFVLDLNDSSFKVDKYYSINYNNSFAKFDNRKFDEYSERTNELLTKSVSSHLVSDVPVGFCLSGGIDSSSIVCLADEINRKNNLPQLTPNLKCFTAFYDDSQFDETKWAEMVVNKCDVEWHKAFCDPRNIIGDLPEIIRHHDMPLCSTSTYAMTQVMRAGAENGVKIMIDGQGGDELFGGYPVFYPSYFINLLKDKKVSKILGELNHLQNSPVNKKILFKVISKIVLNELLAPEAIHFFRNSLFPHSKYINQELQKKNRYNFVASYDFSPKKLNDLLFHYYTDYFLKFVLRFEDRCSMQYSIESRTPFADDLSLAEYVFFLPYNYKIKDGWSKALLRNSMKNVIPEQIYKRTDKMGFSTPQQKWLKLLSSEMKQKIIELSSSTDDYINKDLLLKDWDNIFGPKGNVRSQDFVWRCYNFLIWKDIYFNN